MNKMLKLRGQFKQKKKSPNFGPNRMKERTVLTSSKIENIIENLKQCEIYWKDINVISGSLISVEYVDIVPKSRRISYLFPKEKIVGAKFTNSENKRHIITYYINRNSIYDSLKKIEIINNYIKTNFNGTVTNDLLDFIESTADFESIGVNKTNFIGLIVDMSNVERIYVQESD